MAKGFQNSVKAQEKQKLSQLNSQFLEESFFHNFSALNDPRIERSKEHLLIDIVAISLLAVISGAEGWVAIETYGKAKSEWLKEFLSLPNGIPSPDTFSRVWARIDPSEFQECFQIWINSITKKLGVEVIAIDGKTFLPSLHHQSLWTDFRTVVRVKSERKLWNKTTTEIRFYISSVEKDAQKIGKAIRSHWGIENCLHGTLDVTFSEDKSRIRKDNAPENFALLRRLALNLLKQEKSIKGSLKMKRYRASMDNNYLTQV